MAEFLEKLFSSEFMPHGQCFFWQADILWMHVISDSIITLAYYSIPVALYYFVRKRTDLKFHWLFLMFALFIFACGTTHLVSIWTLWEPYYRFEGVVKLLTAGVSLATAIVLWPAVPRALSLPSPAELERTNQSLNVQIEKRKHAEAELLKAKDTLEAQVDERTSELQSANERLASEVAERKKNTAKLHQLAAIVESSADAIIGKTLEGIITSWNVGAEEIYGYTAEEAIGQSISLIMPDERAYEREEILEQIRRGKPVVKLDTVRQRKNGEKFPALVTVSPILDAEGSVFGASAIGRDISVMKAHEEQLQYYSVLLDTIDEAVISTDSSFRILSWNNAAVRLYGYTPDQAVGKNMLELTATRSIGIPNHQVLKTVHDAGYWKGEVLQRNKQDMPIYALSSITVIRDAFENVIGAVAVNHDISDRKRAEEELLHYTRELERSNQELDQFAYIASHDLKEPLRGIDNYASFIIEDYADRLDDEGREKLRELKNMTGRMAELIDMLLHFSRVGRVELARQRADLSLLVEEVREFLKISIKESGVDVRIPRTLPEVECDVVRIREVVQNLLTNAIKYNDKPDPWIEIGYLDEGELREFRHKEVEVPEDVHAPVFYVKDNGIGIRDKHREVIFRIFKRLHGRNKFGGGTGAGLTIVKKIIERHGGQIWLQSSVGEGTTFYFTL